MRALVLFLILLFLTSPAKAKTLTKEDFKALFFEEVSRHLSWEREDLKLIRFHAEPEEVVVPETARQVVRFRQPPKLGSNTLLVDFYQGEDLLCRVRLMGFVEAMIPVVVLKRPLARHTVVHEEDLALERRPMSRLPKDVFTNPKEVAGLWTRLSLRAGQVLRRSNLEVPPVVKRGHLVKIIAEGPGFVVTAVGEARQDGRPGEVIRVRNLTSKREVFARVIDAQTVKVNF